MEINPAMLNHAICIYLRYSKGTSEPWKHPDDLKAHFPEPYKALKQQLDDLLQCVMQFEIDWNTETLASAGKLFEDYLRQQYPWIEDDARKAMMAYFTYSWK